MGHKSIAAPEYHAFFDPAAGVPTPEDGLPVHEALRPDFVWPAAAKYRGGCAHVTTTSGAEPIDNHVCHCSVCKAVTTQPTTHVVFFKHGDLDVSNPDGLVRQPFNAKNPNGPLELCCCKDCGTPIMLDDKVGRIRVVVPNLMGHKDIAEPTYHAFYDPVSCAFLVICFSLWIYFISNLALTSRSICSTLSFHPHTSISIRCTHILPSPTRTHPHPHTHTHTLLAPSQLFALHAINAGVGKNGRAQA